LKWNMPEKTQHEGKQIWIKKVIATISPFELEGLPMLELPYQEGDVKRLAERWFLINNYNQDDLIHSHHIPNAITNKNLWIEGYKAAQKQYSEENIENIRNILLEGALTNMSCSSAIVELDKYVKSLQKKQFPTSVELTEDLQIIKWYYK